MSAAGRSAKHAGLRLALGLDAWAYRSRLNPWRLEVMRHPELPAAVRTAFDELLAATPVGAEVDYQLPAPKWWFLHHVVRSGFVLHGSNDGAIEEFCTRAGFDAYGAPIDAVFASDDAIWAAAQPPVREADRWRGSRGNREVPPRASRCCLTGNSALERAGSS